MPITPRLWGERGRLRAERLGIDPDRLPPGPSPTEEPRGLLSATVPEERRW